MRTGQWDGTWTMNKWETGGNATFWPGSAKTQRLGYGLRDDRGAIYGKCRETLITLLRARTEQMS